MSDGNSNRKLSSASHRRTVSVNKIEVTIHVYDLLQPGALSTVLWHIGNPLLHSGVVVGDKEYAYGGHDERGVSGVYWNRPRVEPPGCAFRAAILHGFTVLDQKEIDSIVREASHIFVGTDWNLLRRNCNHFTSYLVEQLTGHPAPAWLNRAATIGSRLPCLIPEAYLQIPDSEAVDGELIDDGDADIDDEGAAMLSGQRQRMQAPAPTPQEEEESDEDGDLRPSLNSARRSDSFDTRRAPASERGTPSVSKRGP